MIRSLRFLFAACVLSVIFGSEIPVGFASGSSASTVSVYGGTDQVRLLESEGVYRVLAGSKMAIAIEFSRDDVELVTLSLDGHGYLMSQESWAKVGVDGTLERPISRRTIGHVAYIIVPKPGSYTAGIQARFADGTVATSELHIESVAHGQIIDTSHDPALTLSGVRVELYQLTDQGWELWAGATASVPNPMYTDESGQVGWYVENGTYDVRVRAIEYPDLRTGAINVTNNLLVPEIDLREAHSSLFQYRTSLFAEWLRSAGSWILLGLVGFWFVVAALGHGLGGRAAIGVFSGRYWLLATSFMELVAGGLLVAAGSDLIGTVAVLFGLLTLPVSHLLVIEEAPRRKRTR